MTTDLEFKYPMVKVHALDRGVSDHTPLLLDTSDPSFLGQQNSSKWNLVGCLTRISGKGSEKFGTNRLEGIT